MMRRVFSAGLCVFVMSAVAGAEENGARRGAIRRAIVKQYDANGNGALDPEEKTVVLKQYDNRAGREIPAAVTVHHGNLPKMPDGVHFNAEGQITLGRMAADAVEAFYKATGE